MANVALSQIVEQATKAAKQQEPRPLDKQDLEAAWSVLCPNGCNLSRGEAEELLKLMYPNTLGPKQLRHLVPADGVTLEWLQQLLLEQPPAVTQAVDVCEMAFRVLDPGKTGAVDMPTLKQLLKQLHHAQELSEQEVSMVMQLADADMDGKISLQDFRALYTQQQQAAAAVPAAAVPAAALKQKSRRQQTGPNTAAVTGGS